MQVRIDPRRFGRVGFLSPVWLTPGSGGTPIESTAVDISLGGVGLIASSPVEAGRAVSLAFHLRDAGQSPVVERVSGRVVGVRSDIDGHRVRVKFDEDLERSRAPELTRKVESL